MERLAVLFTNVLQLVGCKDCARNESEIKKHTPTKRYKPVLFLSDFIAKIFIINGTKITILSYGLADNFI